MVLIAFLILILVGCSSITMTETIVKTQTQNQTMTITTTATTETVTQTENQINTLMPPTVKTTIPTTKLEELVPKYIIFSLVLSDIPEIRETTMQITFMPKDENGQLLSINGKLSAEIWTTGFSRVLLQEWENISITKDSFRDEVGYRIDLEYDDFKPEGEVQYRILVKLIIDSTELTTGSVLLLIPPDC